MEKRTPLAITLGDPAGIGAEILLRAWTNLRQLSDRPIVVIGSFDILARTQVSLGMETSVGLTSYRLPANEADRSEVFFGACSAARAAEAICCVDPTDLDLRELTLGQVSAKGGQAAAEWLLYAIELARAGLISGIVTLPLNKEGLHAAGYHYPGHTEILAEKCGVTDFAMVLHRQGLSVAHVTLHQSLRSIFRDIKTPAIVQKIELVGNLSRQLGQASPRIAVSALNPHASDGGLFGDEEATIIAPAVSIAKQKGWNVVGPLPADTLFSRAKDGSFDGVVVMYHDQGHIALKSLGWKEAVNITVGLPIVRTSVAHGTAYDIVGKGLADQASLLEATQIALKLIAARE